MRFRTKLLCTLLAVAAVGCGDDDTGTEDMNTQDMSGDVATDMVTDPCEGVAEELRCDDASFIACDGDLLQRCTANAAGCLVLGSMNCATTGGTCNPETLSCQRGDCEDQCVEEGDSCDGTNLVSCTVDADGCYVETSADCSAEPGGFCNDETHSCDVETDPCAGIEQCDAESRACDGDSLVVCAADVNGCLVEVTTDCAADGTTCSDSGDMPACIAEDPCADIVQCAAEGRACDGDSLVVCAADVNGCLIEETTDCAAGDQVCDASGAMPVCAEPAAPDNCPPATTTLSCATGTFMALAEDGAANIGSYCGYSNYAAPENVYRFESGSANPVAVTISATRPAGSTLDFDLYAIRGDVASCAGTTALSDCLDSSRSTSAVETVDFLVAPAEQAFIAYDIWSTSEISELSGEFTLEITCEELICGNGELAAGETCDDGNTTAGDGCDATCQREPGYICDTPGTPCELTCGNGSVDYSADETCDDGNTTAGDGCDAMCQREPGFACPTPGEACVPTCGDGEIDADELCDDGNSVDGDGCTTCQPDDGYLCTGEPSLCSTDTIIATFGGTLEDTDPTFYRPYASCSSSTSTRPYDVHEFTNTSSEAIYLNIGLQTHFDSYLHVYSAAPDGTSSSSSTMNCVIGNDDYSWPALSGSRLESFMVASGETIFVVVSSFSSGRGDYWLSLAEVPGPLADLDGTLASSDPLWDRPNAYCSANDESDMPYAVHEVVNTSGAIADLTATLTPDGWDAFVHVYSQAPTAADWLEGCLDGGDGYSTDVATAEDVAAGDSIFVVVSSYSGATGDYHLTVTAD